MTTSRKIATSPDILVAKGKILYWSQFPALNFRAYFGKHNRTHPQYARKALTRRYVLSCLTNDQDATEFAFVAALLLESLVKTSPEQLKET